MATARTTRTPAKTAKPASSPASGGLGDLLAAGVAVATAPPKRSSNAKPVLTLDYLRKSLDEGVPLAFNGLTSLDQVNEVKSDLQRAAGELDCGLSKSHEELSDGTYTLTFQAKAEKRKRQYTSADIRQWAYDVKGTDIRNDKGAIPEDIRKAFRLAKGLDKPAASADDKSYDKDQD